MIKRSICLFVSIIIILSMLCLNASAANTQKIVVDPASDVEGTFWDVVKCEHLSPENIHNDGSFQIGWGKDGDIINLVDEIDFGKGLVSLKVMLTHFNPIPEGAKIIVKAGDTLIAELVPVQTASWAQAAEITAELKEPITGKHVVTFEWVNNGSGLGVITFEVTPDPTATNNTPSPTTAPSPTPTKAPTTIPTTTTTINSQDTSLATQTTTPKAKNPVVIITLVSIIIVSSSAIVILFIIKNKKKK